MQKESLSLPARERNPGPEPLSDFEEVGWDYRENRTARVAIRSRPAHKLAAAKFAGRAHRRDNEKRHKNSVTPFWLFAGSGQGRHGASYLYLEKLKPAL